MVHYRRPWIEGLLAAGYVVRTAAPTDKHLKDLEALTGSDHHPLIRLAPRSRNGFNDLACMREMRRVYRKLSPDLVVHFTIKPNIFGGVVARRSGISYLAVITGLGYTFLHGGWRNQTLVPWLYRKGLAGVHKAIFYNDEDRRIFLERNIVDQSNSARINGSGVDLGYFQHSPVPAVTDEGPTFLFLGRILRDKGLIELLNATKLLIGQGQRLKLVIAGSLQAMNPEVIREAEFMANIEAVNQHGQQLLGCATTVTYQPTVSDVRPLLANCHAFVLPSYREGLSIAGAEALATGRPMIVTDVPGCRELIRTGPHSNGYLIESRSVRSLANAMQAIIDSSAEERANMGRASYELARQRFSADITSAAFLKIVEAAVLPTLPR
ncbi:hypothetical protein CEQ90_06470 [Lewinellaceae bacterium SD302]|nr:hypothetical protein CEQ90_06470 [Lewinellaceae bacterium SD302]